jgi:N-acetylglucosaminyl-diphospho-decaprenol L-rhamnosyltransferase
MSHAPATTIQSPVAARSATPDATAPGTSVIVVSYNVRSLLERCLASIPAEAAGRPVEVIVVDNASTDGTVAAVRTAFPMVTVLAEAINQGFTVANNRGVAASRGASLLFLNPDAELTPGALDRLVAELGAHPDVAVVGPRLRFPSGKPQSSRRRFPTPLTALVESTVLQRWWPTAPTLRRYYLLDHSDDRSQDVDWLVGACLLVRRAAFAGLGGFDERFFMYSEELDFCRRARAAGWRVRYLPAAEVIHHEGKSSEQNLARRAQRFQESKCRYFEKYYGQAVGRALRLCLMADTLFRAVEEAAKLGVGHRPALRLCRLRQWAAVAGEQWNHLAG